MNDNLENLKQKKHTAYEVYMKESDAVCRAYDGIFAPVVQNTKAVVRWKSASYGEISLSAENWRDICLYYETQFDCETNEYTASKLKFNVVSAGSFDSSNTVERAKYSIMGRLCDNMERLETAMHAVDRTAFLAAEKAYFDASHEYETARRAADKAEADAKWNAAKQLIVAGTKIQIGKLVKTVERVMPKNIVFAEDFGHRVSMDEVECGFRHRGWTISAA